MNVAVLGGSFNPPHVCHTLAAAWVLSARKVDAVWIMPVWNHAFGKGLASYEHRSAMVELAFAPLKGVSVCHVERELGGESRTVDTLGHLAAQHPDVHFSLIIGADILQETDRWKKWDELVERYGFHILGRTGYPVPDGHNFGMTLPQVSSTALREALAVHDLASCTGKVPAAVLEYIVQHELYETTDALMPELQRRLKHDGLADV